VTEFEIEQELRAQQNGTAEQEKFWPEPLNMKQFLSRPRDTNLYLWDKTMATRGASIVVSQARDGKSYFALNAGTAISRGVPFLGRQTVKSPVLYVSLDNSVEDMDQFVERLGVTSEDQIFIQPKPIPANAEEWLIDVIKRNGYKLVIIDTLQRFFQIEDSNDYSEAVNRMTPLDNFAHEIGLHVLYVHHSGKTGPSWVRPRSRQCVRPIWN
jgi:RecA-family ATPase